MAVKMLKDMNLTDDFLFWTLMADEKYGSEAARYLLSVILQKPIGEVDVHAQKVFYGWNKTLHGIRLDAYIKEHDSDDVSGSFYDLEPDNISNDAESLPLRARYYHNMIDNRCLESGKDYSNLRSAYVIMITSFDPFHRNRMRYTVKTHCIEEPDLPYEDGAATIYLYVDGKPDQLPEDLVQLLLYMKHSTKENAVGSLSAIHSMVEDLKQDKEVQKAAMKFNEYIAYEQKEARAEGLAEGRAEGLAEGRAEGRAEGLAEGRAEGLAEGRAEGRAEGLAEGRAEGLAKEHKNTLREKQRADSLALENAALAQEIAELKKKLAAIQD